MDTPDTEVDEPGGTLKSLYGLVKMFPGFTGCSPILDGQDGDFPLVWHTPCPGVGGGCDQGWDESTGHQDVLCSTVLIYSTDSRGYKYSNCTYIL